MPVAQFRAVHKVLRVCALLYTIRTWTVRSTGRTTRNSPRRAHPLRAIFYPPSSMFCPFPPAAHSAGNPLSGFKPRGRNSYHRPRRCALVEFYRHQFDAFNCQQCSNKQYALAARNLEKRERLDNQSERSEIVGSQLNQHSRDVEAFHVPALKFGRGVLVGARKSRKQADRASELRHTPGQRQIGVVGDEYIKAAG